MWLHEGWLTKAACTWIGEGILLLIFLLWWVIFYTARRRFPWWYCASLIFWNSKRSLCFKNGDRYTVLFSYSSSMPGVLRDSVINRLPSSLVYKYIHALWVILIYKKNHTFLASYLLPWISCTLQTGMRVDISFTICSSVTEGLRFLVNKLDS